ncbi:hypothetical protein ACRB68_18070 [Actinomadura sp. RB68]|uniref:Transposase n=1 Tax=Actinomadura macrotermitis TaxID=2585200 RepID=A0A7K0BSA2_9ACTN|nr:hypothetical protein [Actinomadura macrotermitis]
MDLDWAGSVIRAGRGAVWTGENVRDYERLPQYFEAHLTWAAINVMTRRLARATHS